MMVEEEKKPLIQKETKEFVANIGFVSQKENKHFEAWAKKPKELKEIIKMTKQLRKE